MAVQVIEKFGGLYTNADKYSTPGSPDLNNVLIDQNLDMRKAYGCERVEGATATSMLIGSLIASTTTLIALASANSFFAASSPIVVYNCVDSGGADDLDYKALFSEKVWTVAAVTASSLTIAGADSDGYASGIICTLDDSMADLVGFVPTASSLGIADMETLGGFYDADSDAIYNFLSNGTYSYLLTTDKDSIDWQFYENSGETAFDNSSLAFFDKYGSDIVFVKNEAMTIGSDVGGTFYITSSGAANVIKLYGQDNNPTAKYIEVHKDRLCVANLSKISSGTVAGESWIMISKLYPEPIDSDNAITNSGVVFQSALATILTSAHSFLVGQEVYISGITWTDNRLDDFNDHFYVIEGTTTSAIIVDYTNTNGLEWASGGNITLRGGTWAPSTLEYDDGVTGAGILRCDDNENDEVIQIKSSFGALLILRRLNPYIFTGSIETGTATLARALNVEYGAISPHIFMTAGGVWFITQYGMSKLEGTSIKTNTNELDNIIDQTVAEPIKPTFDDITNKDKLFVYGDDSGVLFHDVDTNIDYILDTSIGQWMRNTDRYADIYFNVSNTRYGLYRHLVFQCDTGYQVWNMADYALTNMNTNYFTPIYAQDAPINTKVFKVLYAILEGHSTIEATNNITINVYYNGAATAGTVITFDVKTGTLQTWDSLTGSSTWNTVTTNGTVTWASLVGDVSTMLERRKFRLGSARTIQFEIQHSTNGDFRIGKLYLDYETLDIILKQ